MRKSFYVDMDSLREIEAALGMARDKSKMILKTAINNVAKQTKREMVEDAYKRYHFSKGKSAINKATTIKKAKVSYLEATVEARGRANDLLNFHVRPRKYYPGGKGAPKWAKAGALRGEALERMSAYHNSARDQYKAFVVRYRNGHLALAERVPGEKMKRNPRKQALKSLYAVSTPKMEEMAYREGIDEDMYDLLQRNIREQMQRFLR